MLPWLSPQARAFRGSVLHFLGDPGSQASGAGPDSSYQYFDDGLLVVDQGLVRALDEARLLLPHLHDHIEICDLRGKLLMPGFVDTHLHYPQVDVIASPGRQLLDWLEHYTFPAEGRFVDPEHAREVAEFFLDELLRNGTTTGLVFGSVHRQSVDVFFEAAERRNLRMVAGKVMMDRNCPEYLRDTPESAERDSRALLERWGRSGRLGYAITPRFAPTSSEAQLAVAGRLARAHPEAWIHSHVAETPAEVAWVRELFPDSRSYLEVYDRFGLLRERAIYAHCIWLDEDDRRRMAASGAAAAFSPTSNLFLGSGLFDIEAADSAGMRFAVATDVGGGTSFSMLRTLSEAYKVAQLRGHFLSPLRAFYLATLGGARALGLDHAIGNFVMGREADFVVIDFAAHALLARRAARAGTLAERLFALMMLGDDRVVSETYVMGQALRGR